MSTKTMKRENSVNSFSRLKAFLTHSKQKFSDEAKQILAGYNSVNYSPPHSQVYREWLATHPRRYSNSAISTRSLAYRYCMYICNYI